jgi:acetate kinase
MKMLVANVGSSSFKCQLLDMPGENQLARAKVERLGSDNATVEWTDRAGGVSNVNTPLPSYDTAIQFVLDKFTDAATGVLGSLSELDAVAFKPVYAKGITGCRYMDQQVLDAMAEYNSVVAPLHNPAYIDAIENFGRALPDTPLVGLFEDFFFDNMPDYATVYPIPWDWTEKYGMRKRLFHSASHFYATNRACELMGRKPEDVNLITCHLGGSSSIQAIRKGIGIDGCGGFTLQNGLPQSIRPGDLDPFLVAFLVTRGEGTVDEVIKRLMTEGGLAAISGMGFDMRDLQQAADAGHERARLAIDCYVHHARKYVGSWMAVLGHVDAITMQGGTGEGSAYIRNRILENLEEFGIVMDNTLNEQCAGKECKISADSSRTQIWVIRVDEEIVVARECYKLLAEAK